MILQALKEYYDRKVADPESRMAPAGFEWKEIPFIVVLDAKGNPVSLSSTFEGTGKSKRAKRFLVPQAIEKTSGISSNLLWENPEYALGVSTKGKPDRVAEKHKEFIKRIDSIGDITDPGLSAVKRFLSEPDKAQLLQHFDEWSPLMESGANLSFQLAGELGLVVENPVVKKSIQSASSSEMENKAVCMITGGKDSIERLHVAIKGVWGAKTRGAKIVSFNLDAFNSFGKDQGANAPVGKITAFKYTTALNHLLGKDSRQRMQVGDASTVFWSEKITNFEQQVVDFFGEPRKDDPDSNTRAVESLFSAVHTGSLPNNEGASKFYVLGLAPNASRIAIRFWIVDTVAAMADKICRHFEDIKIIHSSWEKDTLSLFRLLVSNATQGKAENIPPHIAGDTMRSILEGRQYPHTLLQAVIRRIRAEHEITYPRAALIKACINRSIRFKNHEQQEEIKVSLDTNNTNVGYRLGRLFATLEKIQQEASPGLNATIRDRFYGGASSTPVTVFGNLMRLKNHHLAKLEGAERRIFFEKLLGQIIDGIGDFPSHLKLEDQGRFAIGYYHQVQDFYSKKNQ